MSAGEGVVDLESITPSPAGNCLHANSASRRRCDWLRILIVALWRIFGIRELIFRESSGWDTSICHGRAGVRRRHHALPRRLSPRPPHPDCPRSPDGRFENVRQVIADSLGAGRTSTPTLKRLSLTPLSSPDTTKYNRYNNRCYKIDDIDFDAETGG